MCVVQVEVGDSAHGWRRSTMRHSQSMGRAQFGRILTLLIILLCNPPARAQQVPRPPGPPAPRVFTVVPSGARAGSTVEVTVSGLDLDTPEGLLFSHPGVTAEPIAFVGPPADEARPRNRRRGMGALGPIAKRSFRVTVPADVPLGLLDVRLVNKCGLSNPRSFAVGDLAEVSEQEPNDDIPQAQRVDINSTVNGVISSPTDVDDFVFAGRTGERILAIGLSSSVDSRLLLGLELYDASGKRLALGREYQGTDALLDVTLPSDGDYLLRAHAFSYSQGGPDHFYRISVTTAPWIDAVFPSSIEPGKTADVTVYGRNLPGGSHDPSATLDGRPLERMTAVITAPEESGALIYQGIVPPGSSGLDGFEFRVRSVIGSSNPYLITVSGAPVVLDRGNNETPETAQEVVVPCEIAGRVEILRDRDWYAFTAKKGEILSIEAYAQRIGSLQDLYFALRNGQTKKLLGEFDDDAPPRNRNQADPEYRNQFYTRTEDPGRYRFVAPEDGRYELMVSSREASKLAGPRENYRVRITPERPDFRLVVLPASTTYPDALTLRRGGEIEASVFVWRQDGFNDEITLTADDLPPGVSCPPQVLGTDQLHGSLIFSASADANPTVAAIRVKGTAKIGGQNVIREARFATITWPVPPQQNIPAISRLIRSLVLAVRDQAPFRVAPELSTISVVHGEKATIPLKFTKLSNEFDGTIQNTTVTNVPQPLASSVKVSLTKDGGKAELDIKNNVPPGVYSLIFRAQGQVPLLLDPNDKTKKTTVPMTQPSVPVVVTIIPKELARVTVASNNLSVKPGETAQVSVQLARQFDYAGEFQLELVTPDDSQGVRAEHVTIPAGRDSAVLKVEVAPDSQAGNRSGLIVRAIAQFRGTTTITQEAKFSLNIIK
jgi:hypothetical protein